MSELPGTFFDVMVVVILGLSALLALSRGAVREAFGLASWIGAFVAAFYLFSDVRPMVKEAVGHDLIADAVTVAVVFFAPLLVLKIVGGLIARAIAGTGLGLLDRLVGLGFGLARGALIVCAGYLIGSFIIPQEQHPAWVKEAVTLPQVQEGAGLLADLLPPHMRRQGEQAGEVLREGGAAQGEAGYLGQTRERLDQLIENRAN